MKHFFTNGERKNTCKNTFSETFFQSADLLKATLTHFRQFDRKEAAGSRFMLEIWSRTIV